MARGLTVDFKSDTTGFNRGLDGMQRKTKSTASNIKGTMAKMFAGGLVVAGLRSLITDLDRVGKLAQRFGTSAVTVQKLGVVADLNGTSFERMAKSLTDANRAAEEASSGMTRQADAFKAMGINADEFINMGLQEQLTALSDGFILADQSGQGFSSAQVIMGGSAKELIPLLRQGTDKINEQASAASAASDSTVDAVQAMNDKWTMAKNTMFGWAAGSVEALSKTIPLFLRVGRVIQNTINLALETGVAAAGALLKALSAVVNLDFDGAINALAGGGDGVSKAFWDAVDRFEDNNKEMSDSLLINEAKSKLKTNDKIAKLEEARDKKREASVQRIIKLKSDAAAKEAEKDAAKKAKVARGKFSKISQARGQQISSLATHGGGRGFIGSMSGLTKAALDGNKLLKQIVTNTKDLQTGLA